MKVIEFVELNQPLRVAERAELQPGPMEVILEVGRCGICGSDLHMSADPAYGAKCGDVFGHEYAGTVTAVGTDVAQLRKKDKVSVIPLKSCGHCATCLAGEPAWCKQMALQNGGYSEFVAAAESQCIRLPTSFSLADGAIAEPMAVALHGISRAQIQPGDRILVIGAGPIGLATAFWARRMGASRVVVQDLSDFNRGRALYIGASNFVLSSLDAIAASEEALGGKADIVFDCVGAPGLLMDAVEVVRTRGRVVLLGLCTKPDSINWFKVVQKEISVHTSAFFTVTEYRAALDALDSGVIEPRCMVTTVVSLDDTPRVFEELRLRSKHCKVLISPQSPSSLRVNVVS